MAKILLCGCKNKTTLKTENLLLDKLVNRNTYLTCGINFRGKQREKCTFYEDNGMSTDGAFCACYVMCGYQAP